MNHFLISLFSEDRTGLIADTTAALFDIGINLGDTTFSILGTGAEFTTVCEVPDYLNSGEIKEVLCALPGMHKNSVSVNPFELTAGRGERAEVSHYVTIRGQDDPGLLARVSEVLIEFDANVVRLDCNPIARDQRQDYLMELAVHIPDDRENACLATIENTAGSLGLYCTCRRKSEL